MKQPKPTTTFSPMVSVIMAAYNEEQYIAQAIESIQAQTFKDWELIIINDGSQDHTAEIATKYANSDPRIQLINNQHEGYADALNTGLKYAKSRYIAILDADDKAHPSRLERQYNFLESHPKISILGTWCEFVNLTSGKRWTWKPPLSDREIRKYILKGQPLPHTTIMMRQEVSDTLEGYRAQHFKDYKFIIRALQKFSAANLPEVLVTVNVHSNSVMSGMHFSETLRKAMQARMEAIHTFSPPILMPFYTIRAFFIVIIRLLRRVYFGV